ncbi:ATP-binding protein [Sinomonas flava]|uniref:ATP-binding protein n=1 Tax=Sinomonas flava TaxID=496857 RepID=UPI0031D6685C
MEGSARVADGGVGAALRRLRTAAGLTQEGLAQRAGLSVRAVSDTERGLRTRLYPGTTARLAEALGLTGPDRERFAAVAHGVPASQGSVSTLVPLPRPASALVGRESDLAGLVGLLTGPDARLVTLTGPGGVGKTRLALAAAAACAASFPEGAAFVQLAGCRDTQAAGLAVATAVGANPAHGTVADLVCEAIGTRRMLVVCDTFEGVLEAAAILSEALRRCPGVVFLATSRSPLRLVAERLVRVGPLDAAAAAQLFRARAATVRPGVDLSAAEPLIADICECVQRIPLALELAAARVAHLQLADLRDRLSAQLGVLTGGPVDDDERHRTLEATVAWSSGLLDDAGREALAHLSVFDGWTLAGAAAALGRDPLPAVSALVDQSLAFVPDPAAAHGRYRMLDAVREFGSARLAAAGALGEARDRHADWFLAGAEASAGAMRHAGQREAHREAAADLGNLRLAFRHFEDSRRGTDALRLATALWMFWLWQGGFSEGRAWFRAALAATQGAAVRDADPSLAARARWGAGWLAYHQGDWAEARVHAAELARLAEGSEDTVEQRSALTLRGMLALADRRLPDAAHLLAEALAAARRLVPADPWILAVSTLNDGAGLTHTGWLDAAARRFAEARDLFAGLGDETYRARALRHLAAVRLLTGELASAERLLEESLAAETDAADQWGLAETLSGMAHAAASAHDARRAGALEARAGVVRHGLGVAQHPFDAILAERHLGPLRGSEEFMAGWAEGREEGGLVPAITPQ